MVPHSAPAAGLRSREAALFAPCDVAKVSGGPWRGLSHASPGLHLQPLAGRIAACRAPATSPDY